MARTLQAPPALVGVLIAAASIGGLIGSLVTERLSRRFQSGPVWRGALLVGPLCGLLVPAAFSGWGLLVYALGSAALSATAAAANVIGGSARQALCPPALLGRMSATSRVITWGVIPAGAAVAGALGTWLGVRSALLIVAIGLFLPVLLIRWSVLWTVDRLEDLETFPVAGSARTGA